ncbi:hypothetical protein SAMN05216361_3579 [Marisediminitalea aggregata]|uniref:Uncharacterized protein n=1 Tax=Marisediminitalea aggregata TaxID=634436 RepID=A0A1M5PS64_9ALTE|nr:hypothetical protein SAMN05216361_3579 [Marisediminitalea aggregata]
MKTFLKASFWFLVLIPATIVTLSLFTVALVFKPFLHDE